jgi:hypothetical protein
MFILNIKVDTFFTIDTYVKTQRCQVSITQLQEIRPHPKKQKIIVKLIIVDSTMDVR